MLLGLYQRRVRQQRADRWGIGPAPLMAKSLDSNFERMGPTLRPA
jgi:hypothetical protein